MDEALRIIQNWCRAKDLMVNPSKTTTVIFTRKYKPERIEPLKLWGVSISYSGSACKKALSKNWGIKSRIALWIYETVLLPRLTYAAVAWWPRVEKVAARNLLKSLQGNYLRAVVGAMKTIPTEALEVALCLPPLDQNIIYLARLIAYRFMCQEEKHQLANTFRVLIPTRMDWRRQGFLTGPGVDQWYTDGSGVGGRFGAGVYGPTIDYRESIPVGGLATVFQAEVLAIHRCAEILTETRRSRHTIYICSDSRAAIEALTKTTIESACGHQGIPGNEVADGLAKAGTQTDTGTQVVGVPYAAGKKTIKSWLESGHVTFCRANELLSMSRIKARVGVGLLTGHVALRGHLYNLRITTQKECRLCGEESEDHIHILCHCPALVCKRYRSWGDMFVKPKDLEDKKVNSLIRLATDARPGLLQ
ncbi:PREDICTED: uncharacterized protein LOC105449095 [Wasmannia auropunctata]|uniref:uncharacterized protein LOC105449095 n=1 Tax=Wasmannia auropunctata TaxID=64793 RepID=UPI0005EF8005|nr:PREDICTED: uncharacterized protein LOC105449095 [Wasmannia auropunctata]